MRGWIYLLSNKAMPGLVKIGFTLKDPVIRAKELEQTGVPHPFVVEYEALIEQPRDLEQRVHRKLDDRRERKEWFKCEIRDGIIAIQEQIGGAAILENIKNTDATRVSSKQMRPTPPERPNSYNGPKAIYKSIDNTNEPINVKTTKSRIRFSAIFNGACVNCAKSFSVTVTRHDQGTSCPDCKGFNAIAEFRTAHFPV